MMNKKKWLGMGVAFTMLSSIALTGCSKSDSTQPTDQSSSAKPDSEQVLNLTFASEVPTLDLSLATDSASFTVLGQINEGLTRLDETGKVVPGVAKDWKISPDGLTYTFNLRDDAKWSDGSAVTAKDFEYSWKRTLDPKTGSSYAFMVEWVKGGEAYNSGKGTADDVAVKAIDDKTLEVKLETAKPYFLDQMAFPVFFPLKKDFVEKQGKQFGADGDKILSNGPFVMSKWEHEVSMELKKNDGYWDKDKVKLNTVNFLVVKDQGALENLYQSGQIDRFTLMREQVDTYKNTPEYSRSNDLASGYFLFNENRKIFSNKKIRLAMTYAVNADQYADVIYHDGSTGANGLVPPGTRGLNGEFRTENGDVMKRSENAPKAKQLLQEGLKELGLSEFPAVKLLMSDTDSAKKGAEFVKEEWRKNLGINVDIENVPFKLRLKRTTERDYDVVFTNWLGDYNDPMTFLDMWVTKNDQNKGDWSNAKYDELVKGAQVEPDAKKRMEALYQAEKILMDEMPIGPVYFSATSSVTRPYVKNYVPRNSGPEMDLKTTYIEGKK